MSAWNKIRKRLYQQQLSCHFNPKDPKTGRRPKRTPYEIMLLKAKFSAPAPVVVPEDASIAGEGK